MRRSVIIATVIAVAAVGWILSGQLGKDERRAQADTSAAIAKPEEALASVRVRTIQPSTLERSTIVNGRTEASRIVDLRSEIDGRIVQVAAREGEPVAKGGKVVQIATEDRKAKLAHAEALLAQRDMEYKAAVRLSKKGFRASTQLAEAKANLDSARAQAARMKIELDHTVIRAPFDGVLDTRSVEDGAFVKVGDPVARLVDLDPILVVGDVSERNVADVKVGSAGTAVLADGRRIEGTVRYVGSVADPETRTFRVELEVPNAERTIRDGITSELRLPLPATRAHKLTPALLTLDDAGVIGVKVVDRDDIVRFVPVHILANGTDGIWVAGLDEIARVISVGHEFVKAGQKVRTVEQTPAGAGGGPAT